MNKKDGFTLAEVLITLSILGVVAAVSVPNLIQHHQKMIVENQLKKTYSLVQNSIDMQKVITVDWSQQLTSGVTPLKEAYNNCIIGNLKIKNYRNTYVTKLNKYADYKLINGRGSHPSLNGTYYYIYELNNGAILYITKYPLNSGGWTLPFMYIDVNGLKGPNILGRDLFYFEVNGSGSLNMSGITRTRNQILSSCNTDVNAKECHSLIQKDGFKFSKDYPGW